jgi:hypothetical protein
MTGIGQIENGGQTWMELQQANDMQLRSTKRDSKNRGEIELLVGTKHGQQYTTKRRWVSQENEKKNW